MIKTQHQYQNTKKQIQKFQDALDEVRNRSFEEESDEFLFQQIDMAGLESQLADLRSELRQFEQLVAEQPSIIIAESFDDLPLALIKARIALGLTQRELAGRLGVQEQQVQRYEATDYSSASLNRIGDVVRALNVQIREEILLPASSVSPRTLFRRLKELGLDKELILRRVLPATIRARLEERSIGIDGPNLARQAAATVGRVFNLDPTTLFGEQEIRLNLDAVGAARFRASQSVNGRRLGAYAAYAHHLAGLVLRAAPGLEPRPIPTDPIEFRAQVTADGKPFDYESVLQYAWSRGIVVLPLSDPGAFHGAYWRIDGRHVVILKQKAKFSSRWLLDLLHEVRHAAHDPERRELAVIEEGELLVGRNRSPEEREAVRFAVAVALNEREDELAALCSKKANHSVDRLASAVQSVAERDGVDVGVLADYLAYRMAFEEPPVNWWGAATNLQPRTIDPWRVARDTLLERVDLSRLDSFDRGILMRALAEDED
ncbi:MAG: helix-turn-helix domain-containing protein [Actinomycetota bacterium]|nr:helix-turn-helix domain-containing protein [Actinomycetota bacterium]